MRRRAGWEFSLVEYAMAQRGRPFVWGDTDCFSLARGALEVVYESDPLADVGAYGSASEAGAVLRAVGHPADALRERGATLVPLGMAQQGDLLLMPGDDGTGHPRFAVVVDGRGHVLTSSVGKGAEMVLIAWMTLGTTAWRWV